MADMAPSAAFEEYRALGRLHMNYMLASAVWPGQEHLPPMPRPDLVGISPPSLPISLPVALAHPQPLPTPAPVNNSAESSYTAEAHPDAEQQQQQQNLTAAAGASAATAQEAVKVTKDRVKGETGRARNEQRELEGKKARGRPPGATTDPERAKVRRERKNPYPKKGPKGGA